MRPNYEIDVVIEVLQDQLEWGALALKQLQLKQLRSNSKRQIIHQLLLRRQGATRAELCKAIGWKAINVYVQGIEVRVGKYSKPKRYFGVRRT